MPLETKIVSIRQANQEDLPFVEQMSYEACFPDWLDERPTIEEARQIDWFQAYTRDWLNQRDDFGLIAEDEQGVPLGAAWYRDYPVPESDGGIPSHELVMALLPQARGKKIGKKLLTGLIDSASKNGISELSLIVRENNEIAKALYDKIGFTAIKKTDEGYITMVAPTSAERIK